MTCHIGIMLQCYNFRWFEFDKFFSGDMMWNHLTQFDIFVTTLNIFFFCKTNCLELIDEVRYIGWRMVKHPRTPIPRVIYHFERNPSKYVVNGTIACGFKSVWVCVRCIKSMEFFLRWIAVWYINSILCLEYYIHTSICSAKCKIARYVNQIWPGQKNSMNKLKCDYYLLYFDSLSFKLI